MLEQRQRRGLNALQMFCVCWPVLRSQSVFVYFCNAEISLLYSSSIVASPKKIVVKLKLFQWYLKQLKFVIFK